MLKSHGLHSYVLNNNLKSLGLLTGFLLVVQVMFAAIWSFTGLFYGGLNGFTDHVAFVVSTTLQHALSVLAASLVWGVLAFLYYKHIVRGMTGLHEVSRNQEPRLFNIVENLSIATGLTTPRIEISESSAMNAFAMGLTPSTSTIGVTRGLLQGLNDRELEAVVAHELTHIRTLDVRLMTFATIFCGIIFSIGWFLTYRVRELSRQAKAAPLVLLPIVIWFVSLQAVYPGGLIWQIIGLTAALILAALLISLSLRFSMSRTREFVADLGACELTKNPEALISALAKIHGRNLLPHCDPTVQAMMISAPSEGLFASHPTLEERIDAIVAYAAAHLNGLQLAPTSARLLPQVDTVNASSGFSITKMKYPAWVSKPLIVFPAIATGLLLSFLSKHGPAAGLDRISAISDLISDVINASIDDSAFISNDLRGSFNDQSMPDGSIMDFVHGMSLGEWKIMLFYFCVALAVCYSARFIRSFGFDSDLLRRLSGAPSKEMQSDWEDDTTEHQQTLNMVMERAIVVRQDTQTHQQQSYQQQTQPTRVVFGKR